MVFVHRSNVSSGRLNEDFVDQSSRFVAKYSFRRLSVEQFVMFSVPVVANVQFLRAKDLKCSSLFLSVHFDNIRTVFVA